MYVSDEADESSRDVKNKAREIVRIALSKNESP